MGVVDVDVYSIICSFAYQTVELIGDERNVASSPIKHHFEQFVVWEANYFNEHLT